MKSLYPLYCKGYRLIFSVLGEKVKQLYQHIVDFTTIIFHIDLNLGKIFPLGIDIEGLLAAAG